MIEYGIRRSNTDSSDEKKRDRVVSSWEDVERWMKPSFLSRGDSGRARGSGVGGGVFDGTIL